MNIKKIFVLQAIIFTFLFGGITVLASEGQVQEQDIAGLVQEYQDKMKDIISNMDEETVNEAFSFLKEKAAGGGLQTEAELKSAVEEGKEKFGVQVEDRYVEEMLEIVNTLEEMGFDSEKLIIEAESMYQEYGADFVDHTQELVVEAVKESIGTIIKNAVLNFFKMLEESVKDFFVNLF